MAKIILEPIGTKLEATAQKEMLELDKKLDERRAEVNLGWGAKYQERVKAKGKLTAQERILALADSPEKICPWANSFISPLITEALRFIISPMNCS